MCIENDELYSFDTDDSGGLDREEFSLAMADLGVIITAGQMREVMDETSTQGFISAADFVARMRVAKKDARAAVTGRVQIDDF